MGVPLTYWWHSDQELTHIAGMFVLKPKKVPYNSPLKQREHEHKEVCVYAPYYLNTSSMTATVYKILYTSSLFEPAMIAAARNTVLAIWENVFSTSATI